MLSLWLFLSLSLRLSSTTRILRAFSRNTPSLRTAFFRPLVSIRAHSSAGAGVFRHTWADGALLVQSREVLSPGGSVDREGTQGASRRIGTRPAGNGAGIVYYVFRTPAAWMISSFSNSVIRLHYIPPSFLLCTRIHFLACINEVLSILADMQCSFRRIARDNLSACFGTNQPRELAS